MPPRITSAPITRAAHNQHYTYTVVAADPENTSLTFSLGRRPVGMTISAAGQVQWTPTTAQLGSYAVDVQITDAQGGTSTQSFTLEVGTTAINQPPAITSTPTLVAPVGQAYQYAVQATDPDGGTLTYQLINGPTGMVINPITGVLTWATPVAGTHPVVIGATDAGGLGGAQSFTLTARVNAPPVIRSTPLTAATPGTLYRYDLQASDPEGGALSYTLDATSLSKGITLDNLGRLRWTPTTAQVGTHTLTLTVTDDAVATTSQTFALTVAADTTAPTVTLLQSVNSANPGDVVFFQARATDNVAVANLQLLINNTPVQLDANGIAQFTTTTPGLVTARAIATDSAGNPSETTTTLQVTAPNAQAPNVSLNLTGITDGVITAATNLIGTVDDPDSNSVTYTVEAAPISGGDWRTIFTGNSEVNNNTLGSFDPSLLQNDTYAVRLTATDAEGNSSVVEEVLSVAGELKLGNCLSFTDLSIPVTGIPITLTRTYDTLTTGTTDDFGYGWRMEFRDTDLRTSLRRDAQLEELGLNPAFREGTRVYLTLPGGKREGFTFRPTADRLNSFFGTAPNAALYHPAFVGDNGVTSTLSVRNAAGTYLTFVNEQFSGLNGTGYNPINPEYGSVYILTTKDGTVYEIDARSGDLLKVTDLNGNTLTFTDEAVTSSTGQAITFERDATGRIVSVQDPMQEYIRYEYDAQGDLISVTDREQNTTRMEYNDTQAHYLDGIIDPLNRTAVRNEYDEQGRLKLMVDVEGNPVEMSYDPNNSTQTVTDQLGNPTTYVYDERGNILTEVDAEGQVTQRTYDEDNNVLTQTVISDRSDNPATPQLEGFTTTFTYDANRNKLSETNALGQTTTFTYGSFDRLLSETDANGNTTAYSYDRRGNLLSTTDANGEITNYSYDLRGNLRSFVDAEGRSTGFEYDTNGYLTRMTDALGHATTYTYNERGDRLTETQTVTTPTGTQTITTTWTYDDEGRVLTMTDPEGQTTTYEYDANGKQIAMIDALGHRTEMRYDERGLLIETILPDETPTNSNDNPRSQTIYDAKGQEVATIDELGRVTRYEYDDVGRLIVTIYPDATPTNLDDNPRTRTEYYSSGEVRAQIDELGNRTEFRYDAVGRLVETIYADDTPNTLADNPRSQSQYDAAGRRIAETDALNHTTRFVYDDLGRLIQTQFANGTSTTTAYDDLGRRTAVTDQNGNVTQYRYDALGRLTGVQDALNQWTEYDYDEMGRLIEVEDANDHDTRYEYDRAGRRTATVLPMGQRSTMTYDAVGNLQTMTDFNGEVTRYGYDAQNRLVLKDFEDDIDFSYTYTLTSQIASLTDARGTTTYTYDERERMIARRDPTGPYTTGGNSIEYGYDAAGNRTTLNIPSGQTSYSYNERNWLETVADPDSGTTTYTYDAVGKLVRTDLANGVVELRQYNTINQLLSLRNVTVNPTTGQESVLTSYTYTLDNVGNRLSITDHTGRLVNYDYDALYRLEQERVTQGGTIHTTDYIYDNVGNRLSRVDSTEGTTTYTYDANDRLLNETTGGATTTYGYDNNGNTISKTTGSEITGYTWNDENRLVGVQTPTGDTLSYVYNSEGIRTSSTTNGVTTEYLVDANRDYAQVLEERVNENLIVSYVYGRDLISQERNNVTSFYLVDGLGSTTALTDASGNVTDTYTYASFGSTSNRTGTTENSYQFAGEQFDRGLGDYYLRDRYYDPNLGRFTRRDSYEGSLSNPPSLHRYTYVHNNPINGIDPSGLFTRAETEATLLGLAILGTIAYVGFIQAGPPLESLGGFGEDSQPSIPNHTGRTLDRVLSFGRLGGFGEGPRPLISNTTAGGGWQNTVDGLVSYVFGYDPAHEILMPNGQLIGRSGTSEGIREVSGGFEEAREIFDAITQGGTVSAKPTYPGIWIVRPNGGGEVGLRTYASRSPNTEVSMEVRIPGIPINKIKFNP